MPAPAAKDRRAGPRTKLVTFVSVATSTQDASGAAEDVETTLSQQWCVMKALTGAEKWIPPTLNGQRLYSFVCDYFAGLTGKCRAIFEGRRFDIVFVNNIDEANWQYEILANEAV